uniref:Transposase n=1 Tax=Ascaris lumbricoides TaxID=6252 RepID=A0A0M3I1R9_ASCLU
MAESLDEKVTLYASYRIDSGHLYHMAKLSECQMWLALAAVADTVDAGFKKHDNRCDTIPHLSMIRENRHCTWRYCKLLLICQLFATFHQVIRNGFEKCYSIGQRKIRWIGLRAISAECKGRMLWFFGLYNI